MGVMRCPECGGMVGDTSPVCVDCGHSFGPVATCEECKGAIPRGQEVCPRCAPKIFQYMGIKPPPKRKPEDKKKNPEKPKPPLLNAPRPPAPAPGAAAPSKDDFLEGEATELRKDPYTPAPKKPRARVPAPPIVLQGGGPDGRAAEERAGRRKIHWGAVLLGLTVAGLGAAGYFYYLPKFGLDPRLARLLSVTEEWARAQGPWIAAAMGALGGIELLRGFFARPRALRHCRFCHSEVAAFRGALRFRCDQCGRKMGFRPGNALFLLILWSIVAASAAAIVMVQTGRGL